MRHLSDADYLRTRWKNGAGETVQLAVFPASAGLDDFIWRISMASVIEDGPFSLFPDVDRTLAVLAGDGLELTIDGKARSVTPATGPLRFPADVPTTAKLLSGPVTDFNVMTRRDRAEHRLSVLAPGATAMASADFAAVFAPRPATLRIGERTIQLVERDFLILDPGLTVLLETGSGLFVAIDEVG